MLSEKEEKHLHLSPGSDKRSQKTEVRNVFRSPVESLRTTVAILVSYNVFRLRPSKTIYDKRNRYEPRNRNRPVFCLPSSLLLRMEA